MRKTAVKRARTHARTHTHTVYIHTPIISTINHTKDSHTHNHSTRIHASATTNTQDPVSAAVQIATRTGSPIPQRQHCALENRGGGGGGVSDFGT